MTGEVEEDRGKGREEVKIKGERDEERMVDDGEREGRKEKKRKGEGEDERMEGDGEGERGG